MWIWIISLIVLIVCFIIVWRLFITGYKSMSSDSSEGKLSLFHSFSPADVSYDLDTVRSLKAKLVSLEDKSDYYAEQIDRLNKKIKGLEMGKFPPFMKPVDQEVAILQEKDEDWKEMFYEENEKKEKLENELDRAMQQIESLQEELGKQTSADQQPDHMHDDAAMQQHEEDKRTIESLHRELTESQSQLQELMANMEKNDDRDAAFERLTSKLSELTAENGALKQQLAEASHNQEDINSQIRYINELENKVSGFKIEMTQLHLNLNQAQTQQEYLAQQVQREMQLRRKAEEIAHSIDTYKNENEDLRSKLKEWEKKRAETDAKNAYILDLENKISENDNILIQLKQDLADMAARREYLELELQRETRLRSQYQEAANAVQVLKNENEGLHRQINEMMSRQSEIEGRLLRMKELEEKVTLFEDEKSRMIANLEMILKQSKIQDS